MKSQKQTILYRPIFLLILFAMVHLMGWSQKSVPKIHYKVSIPEPDKKQYHVKLETQGWDRDSLVLQMPRWMPGYYQIMDYAASVKNLSVRNQQGQEKSFIRREDNSILLMGVHNDEPLIVSYDVMTDEKFVAKSYVDSQHAYLIPAGSFYYPAGGLDLPVSLEVENPWPDLATGLESVAGNSAVFTVPDFDILYDSPLLLGDLEELPSFDINGVEHRFIGYDLGTFNEAEFMGKLKRITEAAIAIMGDIPFERFTYIAIGPGRGGIEHLNNTTVSFDGNSLDDPVTMDRMMNFLAHEYFHHYNVKRIRPVELGPFDYQEGSRTHQLWVSEGLTVYYANLITKRAGVVDEAGFLANFEQMINAHENNPGKHHQSLQQASYNTWRDGPFGNQGEDPGKSISYYVKGPIVGLFLDLKIREATDNKRSLDDVMRTLYQDFYKTRKRGFTGAEFQQTAEDIAGTSLKELFEYVYTTEELDYATYLKMAGLELKKIPGNDGQTTYRIQPIADPNSTQLALYQSWIGAE